MTIHAHHTYSHTHTPHMRARRTTVHTYNGRNPGLDIVLTIANLISVDGRVRRMRYKEF
jgi:hypothetical protein